MWLCECGFSVLALVFNVCHHCLFEECVSFCIHLWNAQVEPKNNSTNEQEMTYLALPDETPRKIAKKHGVDVTEILRLNRGRLVGLSANSPLWGG